MFVIIATCVTIVIFTVISLLFLPLTLTVFLVLTLGTFLAFNLSQNPGALTRALSHVRLALPELRLRTRGVSADARDHYQGGNHDVFSSHQKREQDITDSFRNKGKENITDYVRPVLKPRRFRQTVVEQDYYQFQGQTSQSPPERVQQHWMKDSAPSSAGRGGNILPDNIDFSDKHSFSRLPLSPIFPPNKSLNSPDMDLNSSLLRFNSGQDSMLHPSMHYPSHQPDLISSPGLLPSVSWLRTDGLSSPRQRRGLPRVQSPVMVRIASPLPDRPASPLFRKLAAEEKSQKSSSSTDKVIMAIKQRQKRTAQESNAEGTPATPSSQSVTNSKRRKLDGPSAKELSPLIDVDMDVNPFAQTTPAKNPLSVPNKFGITSRTPRNPIKSSISSSRRSQGALKRRKDTSSVEFEEEDGVSPIKKKIPPHPADQAHERPGRYRKPQGQHFVSKATSDASSSSMLSPLSTGGKALFLENAKGASGKSRETAAGTPSKFGLKTLFTPQKSIRVNRVDTPGEYTTADKAEDRAQARQRVSYLKEMLMEEPEAQTSKGSSSDLATKPSSSLFASAATPSTSTATLPTFSLGALSKASTTSATSSILPSASTTTTATSKSSDNPLSATGNVVNPIAAGSQKLLGSNLQSSVPSTATQKTGDTPGFKLSTTPATSAPQSTTGGTSGLLGFLGVQKSTTEKENPLAASLGGGSITQVDASKKPTNLNNTASAFGSAVASTQGNTLSTTPKVSSSGGFTLGGQGVTLGSVATSAAAPATATSQPQFKPIFGAPGESAGSGFQTQTSSATTNNALPKSQSTGFQLGQTAQTTPSKGGFSFGNQQPATTAIPSGLATPFKAASTPSATAATPGQPQFSMTTPSKTTASTTSAAGPQFKPIFGGPQTTPSSTTNGVGQAAGGSFAPAFGAATPQKPTQGTPGGFSFGSAAPATTSAAPSFNFGGTSAPASANTASPFASSTQAAAPFGASKPAATSTTSVFGAKPPTAATAPAPASANPSSVFGAGVTKPAPAFGATNNGTASIFGAASAPTSQSSMFGGASTGKPAFGSNPTATVTPFGGGASQTKTQAASPFPFGGSQPQTPSQPAQQKAPAGFSFGSQNAAAPSFSFGGAGTPSQNSGFQFGQSPAQQPNAAPQQPSMFGSSPAPFGGSTGFGSPAPGAGSTPAPAFGAAPSPAAASGGGGFSIGAGGNNSQTNQRRANRLRQVRNRAGRR